MRLTFAMITALCCVVSSYAQVSDIKTASSKNSSGSGDKSSNNDGLSLDVFLFVFDGLGSAQSGKLREDKERYPSMISLDVSLQGAIKPSSYYILQPRIRGNWGLFSTDFRFNYLIEDGINGYVHIRTSDWQILQLNLITSRFFTLRIGSGIMKEAFASKRTFNESALMFLVHAPDQSKVIGLEFRFAKDWETGVNPRRELNIQYQHQLFSSGILHGYASVGGLYQRYYNTIDVWGVQAGLVFRLF